MQRIVFLDIDGPVIPGHLYTSAAKAGLAANREIFDSNAVERLNRLCSSTGAKVVTNSMQNYIDYADGDLKDDLVQAGLKVEYFHSVWRTAFPRVDYSVDPNPRRGWGRWLGIRKWMDENGEADWICFDDRHWSDDSRLILVDFHDGITEDNYQYALDHFLSD
jgi:hypothetical protein